MATSKTNNLGMAVATEASIGVLPATPLWSSLEPNTIGAYGAVITTVPRAPISNTRQNRKGSITDLDSSVEWEGDNTIDHMNLFIEGFIFASRNNPAIIARIQAGADYETLAATGSDTFTHTALTSAILEGSLVFGRGFTNSENNGLFEIAAASTTTVTELANTPGTVVETPATTTGARVDVCGFRFTDLVWTDATNTLSSTLIDFATLGLTAGQMIRVGSTSNAFPNGSLVGRIVGTPTTAAIVLDKIENLGAGTLDGGGDETADDVDLLYGPFTRNVPVSDADFLERSFQFELVYDNLQNPTGTGDEYEYAIGNLCNEMVINLPGQDKATVGFSFIGTNSDDFTTSRKGNTANQVAPVQTAAFNTSSSFVRLNLWTVAEVDLATCFKSLTLTLGNEVSPEKCLATLGAIDMNTGNFTVGLEAELLFTHSAVPQAIKDNDTITMDLLLSNDDGAFAIDIPSLTLGDGTKNYPVNESIKINVTGQAFADPTLDTSLSYSEFPYYP